MPMTNTVYAQNMVPIENLRHTAPVTYTPPSQAPSTDGSSGDGSSPSTATNPPKKGITLRQAQAEDTTGFSIAQMLEQDFVSPTAKHGSIFDILA
jgi:hypothetical protein